MTLMNLSLICSFFFQQMFIEYIVYIRHCVMPRKTEEYDGAAVEACGWDLLRVEGRELTSLCKSREASWRGVIVTDSRAKSSPAVSFPVLPWLGGILIACSLYSNSWGLLVFLWGRDLVFKLLYHWLWKKAALLFRAYLEMSGDTLSWLWREKCWQLQRASRGAANHPTVRTQSSPVGR